MKVYGVYVGVKYEGGSVMPSLYKSYAKAKRVAMDKIEFIEADGGELSKFRKLDKEDAWCNGIDVVAIKKFNVADG